MSLMVKFIYDDGGLEVHSISIYTIRYGKQLLK